MRELLGDALDHKLLLLNGVPTRSGRESAHSPALTPLSQAFISARVNRRVLLQTRGDDARCAGHRQARAAVDDYLHARTDHSPALFISFQPASKDTTSNRLTVAGAQHLCRQVAHRLGIPTFHPHQLRHTLGALLQETMGDARLTADTLGHRGLASVAGYTKITDQRRREAYEQLQQRGL